MKALSKAINSSKSASASRAVEIKKPQLQFDHVPTNSETGPFKPLLESKPHARTPLSTTLVASGEDSNPHYPHPYQLEIEEYRYPSSVYTQSEPIPYRPFESTSAIFVDSEEALTEMLKELKNAKEIAIDLEHHDSRTYIGIVSLMQISTRHQDWIVDTLKPWRRKLQCLNEVFADPSIVKVLHGAFMDIIWLQRDLGLYLVGLFDTHYAARALGYSGGSLAFLLKKFVNVDAQKQYQLADWRIRPLPQELLDYARSDTHYLLYIFDCMRNELIERSDFSAPDHEKDKIWDVLQKSSETALKRYEHPIYDADLGQGATGWYRLLSRTPVLLSKQQFSVFRALHKWRDDVAREQDDSTHYIMPNHNIFTLAKALPSSRAELTGLLHPMTKTIRERAGEMMAVISNAKEAGEHGPEMMAVMNQIEPRHSKQGSAASSAPAQPTGSSGNAASSSQATRQADTTSVLPLRSSKSSFWGSIIQSMPWSQKRSISTAEQVPLAVPLPDLTAEVFADPQDVEEQSTVTPEPSHAESPRHDPTDEKSEDIFILKETGKKRKYTNGVDGMAAQSDEILLMEGRVDARAKRKSEKAERKKAKKAQRAQRSGATQSGNVSSQEDGSADHTMAEPFDYASAPSILNPPREDFATARERKKKEKQVNPYAKALDTSTGLPRSQKEKAGRSMTFNS